MNVVNFKKNFIFSMLLFLIVTFSNEISAQTIKNQRYKVAVCDWMILKRQKLGSFQLASEIKADGIELDMGGLGNRETFDSKLTDPVEVKKFKDKSKEFNVGISSIAMSGFYSPCPLREGERTMAGLTIQLKMLRISGNGGEKT